STGSDAGDEFKARLSLWICRFLLPKRRGWKGKRKKTTLLAPLASHIARYSRPRIRFGNRFFLRQGRPLISKDLSNKTGCSAFSAQRPGATLAPGLPGHSK